MLEKLIKRLENEGKLKKQRAGIVQVEAMLKDAMIDLEETKKISHLAQRATYLMAYTAMLKAGRALLLMKGYVPDDGAQHKTIVEITAVVLGDKYKGLTDHFENMRRRRNEITYKSGAMVPKSEANAAFESAIALVRKILDQAKTVDLQLEFDL